MLQKILTSYIKQYIAQINKISTLLDSPGHKEYANLCFVSVE